MKPNSSLNLGHIMNGEETRVFRIDCGGRRQYREGTGRQDANRMEEMERSITSFVGVKGDQLN